MAFLNKFFISLGFRYAIPPVQTKTFITNTNINRVLEKNPSYGGLFLLVGPKGCGKSTAMRDFYHSKKQNGIPVAYFTNNYFNDTNFTISDIETVDDHSNKFYDRFHLFNSKYRFTTDRSLEYFPNHSIIVFENAYVNPHLLLWLAIEGRRTETTVVLSTDNLEYAKKVRFLNGQDKISLLTNPSDLMWNDNMIKKYVQKGNYYNQNMLIEHGCIARTPKFLNARLSNTTTSLVLANMYKKEWNDYENFIKNNAL